MQIYTFNPWAINTCLNNDRPIRPFHILYKCVQRKKGGRENNRVKAYIDTTATERRILGEVIHGRKDKYTKVSIIFKMYVTPFKMNLSKNRFKMYF